MLISRQTSGKINIGRNKISLRGEIFLKREIMSRIIELTKLDTRKILINPDMIETVEGNPDTVLVLQSGRKVLVKEDIGEIYKLINS